MHHFFINFMLKIIHLKIYSYLGQSKQNEDIKSTI